MPVCPCRRSIQSGAVVGSWVFRVQMVIYSQLTVRLRNTEMSCFSHHAFWNPRIAVHNLPTGTLFSASLCRHRVLTILALENRKSEIVGYQTVGHRNEKLKFFAVQYISRHEVTCQREVLFWKTFLEVNGSISKATSYRR